MSWISKFFQKAPPPPPIPPRPPTPQETKQAASYLAEARAHIDQHVLTREPGLDILQYAAKALQSAARLDPNATFSIEDKDLGTLTFSNDILAAETLYYESLALYNQGRDLEDRQLPASAGREFPRKYRAALEAVKRADILVPNTVLYLTWLARMYNLNGDNKNAREAVTKALQLDPTNEQALRQRGYIQ